MFKQLILLVIVFLEICDAEICDRANRNIDMFSLRFTRYRSLTGMGEFRTGEQEKSLSPPKFLNFQAEYVQESIYMKRSQNPKPPFAINVKCVRHAEYI